MPLSLAIVCNAFPAGQQARALGIWAGISAVALGIGPLAGGALVDLDWRLIFWINLPIAAIGIAITAFAAPESRDPGSGRRIDLRGLATLGVGLTAVVLALVQSRVWSTGVTIALALLGLICLYAFWRIEHRVAEPIVDFSLFRNSPYFGASAAAFALVGARRLMTAGMILGIVGLLSLTQIDAGSSSGVLAMDRVMAGTIALAVTGAVFHALLGDNGSFADAVGGSTWVLVALCAIGAVLTWAYVRDPDRPGPDLAVAGEPPPEQLHHHRHHHRFHL